MALIIVIEVLCVVKISGIKKLIMEMVDPALSRSTPERCLYQQNVSPGDICNRKRLELIYAAVGKPGRISLRTNRK